MAHWQKYNKSVHDFDLILLKFYKHYIYSSQIPLLKKCFWLCWMWQLTISGDRLGCTVEQKMSHHSWSKFCRCSEPWGGLTNRVSESKYWSHGLFDPMKCTIFAPSPNLEINILTLSHSLFVQELKREVPLSDLSSICRNDFHFNITVWQFK